MSKDLLTLPQELQDMIVVDYLDPESLFQIRATCNALYNTVTRMHIGYSLFTSTGEEILKTEFREFCQLYPCLEESTHNLYFFNKVLLPFYYNPSPLLIPKENIPFHPTLKLYCQTLIDIVCQHDLNLLGKIQAFYNKSFENDIYLTIILMIAQDPTFSIAQDVDAKHREWLYAICLKTIPFYQNKLQRLHLETISLDTIQRISQDP